MKVTSQELVKFSGYLAATTADTQRENVFICLGKTAFIAGAAAGHACAAFAVPGPGWAMAAILGAALLVAVRVGYLKCKGAASSRVWVNPSNKLVIHGNRGLVVGKSQLFYTAENTYIDIKETFWGALGSTTLHNLGHLANFAFGFLAGRGFGSMASIAIRINATEGLSAAGKGFITEFGTVARTKLGNMFNPASLFKPTSVASSK